LARAGTAWGLWPKDLPPWEATSQQTQRWMAAEVCEAIIQNLRMILRLAEGHTALSSMAILERQTLPVLPEGGSRAGDDAAKRQPGSRLH